MKVSLTEQDLIAFEEEIVDIFSQGKIRAPIHLDNDNEKQLIEIFEKYVDEDDWCASTWRSHYRCLLKGVPQDKLKEAIIKGDSICLCFPEYRYISSAIVGGIFPIMMGVAWSIKRKGEKNKVVCFGGDMGSMTGSFYESVKYAQNHDLPILFVIENNKKSVCTPTYEVWNTDKLTYDPPSDYVEKSVVEVAPKVLYYTYSSKFPHAGGLTRVQF